jgi:hypothetical protein
MASLLLFVLAVTAAAESPTNRPEQSHADSVGVPGATETHQPDPAWKPLGRALWFEPKHKRLIIAAKVVLREGPLEHLVCLKGTKEHEAILATQARPRDIHAGLLLTGAEPGHPVRFLPKFEPPAGEKIAIELRWKVGGKTAIMDARRWVRDEKTGKSLAENWVFAGSELFDDPVTKQVVYAADEGDLITVANFGSSILDLPLASSASDAARIFGADPTQIPPLGTEVFLFLQPCARRRDSHP